MSQQCTFPLLLLQLKLEETYFDDAIYSSTPIAEKPGPSKQTFQQKNDDEDYDDIIYSTPVAQKPGPSKQKVQPKKDEAIQNDVTLSITCADNGPESNFKEKYSNSSLMLIELFGEMDGIKEFDNVRKDMKQCAKQRIKAGGKLEARYSTLITNFRYRLKKSKVELKKRMKCIETNALKVNSSLCFKPSEASPDYQDYVILTKHLKYITALLKEFNITSMLFCFVWWLAQSTKIILGTEKHKYKLP